MSALLRAWASTSALYLSGLWLPLGGFFLMLLTPQPGLRLERTVGVPHRLVLVALVTATVGILGGVQAAAFYLGGFALLTLLLPVVLRRGWSVERTVAVSTAAFAAAIAAVALVVAGGPARLFAAVAVALENARDSLLAWAREASLPAERYEALEAAADAVVAVAGRLAPALLVTGCGLTVLLNLAVVRWRQRRAGGLPVFGDLTRWSVSPGFVWVWLASGYGSFVLPGQLAHFAQNLFVVALAIYLLQGIAIVEFWFGRWRVPRWLRFVFYGLVASEWPLAAGLCLVGVFDLWAGFRRIGGDAEGRTSDQWP
jgi:uncharacterized protein YybS (DUF2232 family)